MKRLVIRQSDFLRSSDGCLELQDPSSSKISRSPMIFNIRCAFRGRAQPELDSPEPMLFVELACGMVFLVRMQLQSVGMQCLGKEDET